LRFHFGRKCLAIRHRMLTEFFPPIESSQKTTALTAPAHARPRGNDERNRGLYRRLSARALLAQDADAKGLVGRWRYACGRRARNGARFGPPPRCRRSLFHFLGQASAPADVHHRSKAGARMMLKRNGQKLSAADVSAIQRAHGSRGLVKRLAAQYGVSHSLISMIRSGKRWDVPNWPLIETKLEREFERPDA